LLLKIYRIATASWRIDFLSV